MNDEQKRPPGRPRSEASRAAILDAAYWQTLERGYANVTAESIAKAAGAGKQTLYRWWPSKAAVIIAAFAEKARARIDRPLEAAIRGGDVLGFLKGSFAALTTTGPVLRHLLAEAQSDPNLLLLLREQWLDPRDNDLRRTLEARGVEAAKRETVIAALHGAIWRRLLLSEPLDEKLAVQLAALVS
jgi:AcrR family transcriptional regulator